MLINIIERHKKGSALTRGTFGCLKGHYSLNVTVGCCFSCVYCYARAYPQAPPKGDIYLFSNLPLLLKKWLDNPRRKSPIDYVIFNTASDCFQPHPDILKVTYDVTELLLTRGVTISCLTKGVITTRFIKLFKQYPEQLHAQIGLVSLSSKYTSIFEPHVPSPEERLMNISNLISIGVTPTVRMDPIVPFLTDNIQELERLFKRLQFFGVKTVSLSYLHLRPAIARQLVKELPVTTYKLIESLYATQPWREVGTSTKSKLIPATFRQKGYKRITEIAKAHGIKTLICRCKNPDIDAQICQPTPNLMQKSSRHAKQLNLFFAHTKTH